MIGLEFFHQPELNSYGIINDANKHKFFFIRIHHIQSSKSWLRLTSFGEGRGGTAGGGIITDLVPDKHTKIENDYINTLRPRQNGRHFADDIFKWIFLNENVWILIKFSLKFVPRGPINNIPALVQIMAWRRPGDKPLSGPMMVRLPTHICVTRPQWVNVEITSRHWLAPWQ